MLAMTALIPALEPGNQLLAAALLIASPKAMAVAVILMVDYAQGAMIVLLKV